MLRTDYSCTIKGKKENFQEQMDVQEQTSDKSPRKHVVWIPANLQQKSEL